MPTFSGSYYGAPNMAKPGTTDPAYVRRRALIQQLQGQSAQFKPAHSAAEALARALTPMAYAWEGKIEDERAAERDKRFATDFQRATSSATDPQKLADALAASENPDVAGYAPAQRIDDARAAREAAIRDQDWARRVEETEKDRAQRLKFHEDQLALQRAAAARAGAGTYSNPVEVMVDGKPTLVRFNSRGGYEVVSGVAPLQPAPQPPFSGTGEKQQAANLVLTLGPKVSAGQATPEEQRAFEMAKFMLEAPTVSQTPHPDLPGATIPTMTPRALPQSVTGAATTAPRTALPTTTGHASTQAAPAVAQSAPASSPEVSVSGVQSMPQPKVAIGTPQARTQLTPDIQKRLTTAHVETTKLLDAVDVYKRTLEKYGGTGINTFLNNPRSPEAQEILGAFQGVKMAMRGEALMNTGVLQPGENQMLDNMLLHPSSIRGAIASNEAIGANLEPFREIVLRGYNRVRQAGGLPPMGFEHFKPQTGGVDAASKAALKQKYGLE